MTEKGKSIFITSVLTILMVMVFYGAKRIYLARNSKIVRACYIYIGDESTTYTQNFIYSQKEMEKKFGNRIVTKAFYNIWEAKIGEIEGELIGFNPDIVFATSYGYQNEIKKWAKKYPSVQFVQFTGNTANKEEFLDNLHNCMGTIYEGRYVSGIIAGIKLRQLIIEGKVKSDEAYVGYVGAFPYAEVISGYTAFFLGVLKIVPQAKMKVAYINSWNNYYTEKKVAKKLIEDGCVIISQHSDTAGPAIACQELNGSVIDYNKGKSISAYHVGYNDSMMGVAATTTLGSSRINWTNYQCSAIKGIMKGKKIESYVDGRTYRNDSWAGFDKNWVEILDVNWSILPRNARSIVDSVIHDLKHHKIDVFSGKYTGTNPNNPEDKISLEKPFMENENFSSPKFEYILDGIVEIVSY